MKDGIKDGIKDGMILFHGSYCPVEEIDLDKCEPGKDFGRGFYLTSDARQARDFIRGSLIKADKRGESMWRQNFGYVSSFIYHDHGLATYSFETTNKEWLWFVALNRNHRLAKELRSRINKAIFNAEIISGKIANDKTNPTLLAYLTGVFGDVLSDKAAEATINLLLPNRLSDQICFLTERAVQCLEFKEAKKYGI